MAVTPEMQSAFPEYDKLIGIYWFSESGIIYGLGLQIVTDVAFADSAEA